MLCGGSIIYLFGCLLVQMFKKRRRIFYKYECLVAYDVGLRLMTLPVLESGRDPDTSVSWEAKPYTKDNTLSVCDSSVQRPLEEHVLKSKPSWVLRPL